MKNGAKRILIVDDEEDTLFFLRERLELEAYEVFVAKDGVEGIEQAIRQFPNIILLDIMMPRKNGYEVCMELKQDIKMRVIPVVMLSAKAQESDIQRGMELGAREYITKPFDLDQLIKRVKEILNEKGL